ncbi:MAG: TonB-dependent receptor [Acidobacteria bacterium]|nr:TonB-dependent receptor [Acidobacteriota bacterium]
MQLGEARQTISVQASAPLLQPTTPALGQVVAPKTIVDLPLNGRNYIDLTKLTPGVTGSNGRGSEIPNKVANGAQLTFVVNGQRTFNNSCLIDGIEARDVEAGECDLLPSIDAIQEFKVMSAVFPAQYGWGDAIINVVTKSGSNQLHGTVWEFLRNDLLDASSFFANASHQTKEELRRNQFGFSLGGPIVRDKTFFFGNYEGSRQVSGSTGLANVPTLLMRQGIFPTAVHDPITKVAFSNNTIPTADFTQFANAKLALWPQPNLTGVAGANFVRPIVDSNNFDEFDTRVDHTFSERDRLMGRFLYDNVLQTRYATIPYNGEFYPSHTRNAALSETHLFGPSLINVFTFGYNYGNVLHEPEQPQPPNGSTAYGLTNVPQTGELAGPPSLGVTGYAAPGPAAFSPEGTKAHMFQLDDDLTWIKGRHTVTFGGGFRHYRLKNIQSSIPRGSFSFNGHFTGNSFADFLLGVPNQTQIGYGSSIQYLKWLDQYLFAQDDYKILPNLTLNLGVRWEYSQPPTAPNNAQGRFSFSEQRYLVVGVDPIPRGVVDTHKLDFSPRVGLAWSPTPKTVVRTGYGLYWLGYNDGIDLVFLHHIRPFLVREDIPANPTIPNLFTYTSFAPPPPPSETTNFAKYPDPGARIFTYFPNQPLPYVQQWDFDVQRELARNLMVDAAYVGSHSIRLWGRLNLNQASPDADLSNPTPVTSRFPYPNFGICTCVIGDFPAWYNAFQAKVEKRYSQGFSFLAAYTFSKTESVEDSTAGDFIQNSYAPMQDKGLADFNRENVFTFSATAELPVGRGLRFGSNMKGIGNAFLGGWQGTAIVSLQSGPPVFISSAVSDNQDTLGPARPNRICNGNLPKSQRTLSKFIDTSCFVTQPFGALGNAGRNVVFGPGINNMDLAALKNFPVTERVGLQFRAEFFNALNHAQFVAPNAWTAGTGTFGTITGTEAPRQIQFALKLLF